MIRKHLIYTTRLFSSFLCIILFSCNYAYAQNDGEGGPIPRSKVTVNASFPIDGQSIQIDSRKHPELPLPILSIGERRVIQSTNEVRKMAEEYRLLEESKVNPHLAFRRGDLAFFAEEGLTEETLSEEFWARRIVLIEADQQGVKIKDQGVLSWAATQVRANIKRQ